jgi:hypothetical protein
MQTSWSSLLKQKQYIVLYIMLAIWFLIWTGIKTFDAIYCGYSGYGKYVWYKDGKKNNILTGSSEGVYFPGISSSHSEYETLKKSIRFDNYDRYVQCGDLKYAERINVVRFSVNSPFKFKKLTKYNDAGEILFWHKEPIEGYVTSSVYRKQKMWRDQSTGGDTWLTVQDNGVNRIGRFELIKSFDIEWLKDESLDETHLVGVWQGGWLFRSNKPDHYVWVN